MCNKYKIGETVVLESGDKKFVPRRGYTDRECLQLITIRYQMSLYSFSKYIATTESASKDKVQIALIRLTVKTRSLYK